VNSSRRARPLAYGSALIILSERFRALPDAKAETQRVAEEARENAVTLAVVTFISLLIGAFIACVAAALGGRHRNEQELRVLAPRQ
jgi:hypothetical protein